MNPSDGTAGKTVCDPREGGKRPWLTAEEFVAHVEAHRKAREEARLSPQEPWQGPAMVRDYVLNPDLVYTARRRGGESEEGKSDSRGARLF